MVCALEAQCVKAAEGQKVEALIHEVGVAGQMADLYEIHLLSGI